MKVSVDVPATTANLGPGFDCLGMALDLRNKLSLEIAESPRIEISGEGAATLSRDSRNLAYRAAVTGFELCGRSAPPLHLTLTNAIPLARGLGSSSAAIVGGLLAGAALAGLGRTPKDLVGPATKLEGHPDNVAPALLGGVTVAVADGNDVHVARVSVPPELKAVVFVPETHLSTAKARSVLPDRVPRADAVFNVGRAALLVAALAGGRLDLLPIAGQDKLHQPYRAALVPGMDAILPAALAAGARLAALSGAGPSLLALVDGPTDQVASAMRMAAGNVRGAILVLPLSADGARVVSGSEA